MPAARKENSAHHLMVPLLDWPAALRPEGAGLSERPAMAWVVDRNVSDGPQTRRLRALRRRRVWRARWGALFVILDPSHRRSTVIELLLSLSAMAEVATTDKVHRRVIDCLWVLLYTIASLSFSFYAFHQLSRQLIPTVANS